MYRTRSQSFAIDCRVNFWWCFSFLALLFIVSLDSPGLQAEESPGQVYFYHALKSKQEGRLLTAERLFQKAIDFEPENPDFHFELGNLYMERKNIAAARIELEQAVMIAPDHKPAHYNLGLVYRELGLAGEARDEFQRVLELDPIHVKAQLQIGYTYEEKGFLDDARLAFERARQMDVTDPEPIRALEDLAESEREARGRSENAMGQTGVSQPQASSKNALLQAGTVLLQRFLARRAQRADKSEAGSS